MSSWLCFSGENISKDWKFVAVLLQGGHNKIAEPEKEQLALKSDVVLMTTSLGLFLP